MSDDKILGSVLHVCLINILQKWFCKTVIISSAHFELNKLMQTVHSLVERLHFTQTLSVVVLAHFRLNDGPCCKH